MATKPTIMWFRQDLRLADNPALTAAAQSGAVLPIYILDDVNAGEWAMGGASRWWLHHSLAALDKSLHGKLALYRGDAREIIPALIAEAGAGGIMWNRSYEPWRTARDKQIKESVENAQSFKGTVLYEPWEIQKGDGTPYRVFTPFYKANLARGDIALPLPTPQIKCVPRPASSLSLDDLALLPTKPRWDKKMEQYWTPGEDGARERLLNFNDEAITHYKTGRDRPDQQNVSRLSPHLHYGEISPRQIWHIVGDRSEAFTRQLFWREFSLSLLFFNPTLPAQPLLPKFNTFAWHKDDTALSKWQRGQTGYPIIDAGMRELWETGTMHNRVRMVVASFLIKDLLIHWTEGEKWFWDTLCDADLANNAASWQWVAGCGADAAPYFRVFNPVTQGTKFDPEGDYVRRWVPELAKMPAKYIHAPWDAPDNVLSYAGVALGKTYPAPMIEHARARDRALALYKEL
ncbi:MAG: DNA photolyase family protein [Alphaproteobacteria bacterium]|nr:DNA photolyase family protein [Alphaproteobacteria bacterium]